jgi:hypothetical protein
LYIRVHLRNMAIGGKALIIIGAGAVLALGISASKPTPSATVAPSTVVAPKTIGSNPVVKPLPETVPIETGSKPTSKPVVPDIKPASDCHPSYSGCLKMNAGDYDCAGGSGNGPNYTDSVQVYGSDPFDLDRDNDGWGCEN